MGAIVSLVANSPYSLDPVTGVWSAQPVRALRPGVEELCSLLAADHTDRSLWSTAVAQLLRSDTHGSLLGFSHHLPLQTLSLDGIESAMCVGTSLGGIVRYLGEKGIGVTALVSDPDEALLTAARAKDLDGVRVICEPEQFAEEPVGAQLGIIGLLGKKVAESEVQRLVGEVARCLDETGTIVVLVDNPARFLWAGSNGTEFRAAPGFEAWNDLLTDSGFRYLEWSACYPSPELPLSMVQEKAFVGGSELVKALVHYGLSHSLGGVSPHPDELAALSERGIGIRLAPGWALVGHKHRVHRILHRGEIAHRLVLDAASGDLVREEWRAGGEPRQPWHRVTMATPHREVLFACSEALPAFRTAGVLRHEIHEVQQELLQAKEALRLKTLESENKERALKQAVEDSRILTDSLAQRIEALVRSEERTIRILANSKEEIQLLEEQCETLEKRKARLEFIAARLSKRSQTLSAPKFEPSLARRFKAAIKFLRTGRWGAPADA